MGNWKGIRKGPKLPLELYGLSTDLHEDHNVASAHPDIVKRIEQIMATARTDDPEWPILTPEQARKRSV